MVAERPRNVARIRLIDWSAVVLDLRRCGMSHQQIAGECDADKSWVHRLLNIPGTQPRFHHGVMLLGLWAERTGKSAEDVPRE